MQHRTNNGHESPRVPRKIPVAVPNRATPNLYKIVFKEGGPIPKVLSGLFKLKEANIAIDLWVKGYTRKKIYPKPPRNDKPTRLELKNEKAKKECNS